MEIMNNSVFHQKRWQLLERLFHSSCRCISRFSRWLFLLSGYGRINGFVFWRCEFSAVCIFRSGKLLFMFSTGGAKTLIHKYFRRRFYRIAQGSSFYIYHCLVFLLCSRGSGAIIWSSHLFNCFCELSSFEQVSGVPNPVLSWLLSVSLPYFVEFRIFHRGSIKSHPPFFQDKFLYLCAHNLDHFRLSQSCKYFPDRLIGRRDI